MAGQGNAGRDEYQRVPDHDHQAGPLGRGVRERSSGRDHDIRGDRRRDDRAAEYPAVGVEVVNPVEDEFHGGETAQVDGHTGHDGGDLTADQRAKPQPEDGPQDERGRFSSTDRTTIQPVSAVLTCWLPGRTA